VLPERSLIQSSERWNMRDGLPVLQCGSRAEWEVWLGERHATSGGVWLKIAKKGSGRESLTYAEALEVALCYGWIDGQKGTLDDAFWLQRFTARGRRSKWSKINCEKAVELIEAGRMQAAGLAAVEAAQSDGRWDRAYEGASTISVPADLREKLDENPSAAAFFAGLDSTNRYAVLYRIHDAKKPETRARRIEKFVAMLARGEKIHP
jgi:uncharacterized protein YdeI (YjbR/CyaY-like superfamily)